jgi:formyl-CoA transferase
VTHSGGAGALDGLLVLDCTQILAGPYCGSLLADMGADVIKIEKPAGGDDVRSNGTFTIGGDSPQFHALNRNKRSLAIDLRDVRGRDLFLQLVERADVVLENFRPGAMDRLGLGYDVLRAANPGIILCSISGFGQDGPYRDRGGFDLIGQGMSGLMSTTGSEDGTLAKIGVPITDLGAGMLGCIGILSAVIARQHSGVGQRVETSLLEAGISYTVTESAYLWATGSVAEPNGTAHRVLAPYQAVRTSDGQILLACGNDRAFSRLCDTLGRNDLLENPLFLTNKLRVHNRQALIAELESVLATDTSLNWVEILNAAGCPSGPIYNIKQVYEDPQVATRNMVVKAQHPLAGETTHIGVPIKFSETPATVRTAAPMLGQHSREILRDVLGLDEVAIESTLAAGVVKASDSSAAQRDPQATH